MSYVPGMAGRGTLLELVQRCAGDWRAVVVELRAGWCLTGNFRGKEAEIAAQAEKTPDAEKNPSVRGRSGR